MGVATKAENRMGRWGAVSYIVGNIVGSGIFIVPGTILHQTQSVGLSLAVWLLSAAIATLGAFCYVELGTSIRRSGGDFAYLCHVKWHPIAFAFMFCGCILTFPLTLAIQAETFAEYFLQCFHLDLSCAPKWAQLVGRKLIGYGLCWLLLFLNFFSLRAAVARFQMICSLSKVISIGLIIMTGFYFLLFHEKSANLARPFANSNFAAGPLVNAFFAGLFSYDGWDILNFGAEEVMNPGKSMAFAIPVGIITVACLYVCVNLAYFIVIPIDKIAGDGANSVAIATTFAEHSFGPAFQSVLPFLVCIMLVGSLNSTLFVASRYMQAAARQGQLPAFLSLTNVRHDSPRAALLVHFGLAILFSFLGSIDQLISYVSFAMWAQRVFTMCALLRIRLWPSAASSSPIHPDAIRTPLFLPLIFLAICLALVFVTIAQDFATSSVGLAMLGLSLLLFFLFLWPLAFPRFRLYQQMSNSLNDGLCQVSQLIFDGQIHTGDEINEKCQQQEEIEGPNEKSPVMAKGQNR